MDLSGIPKPAIIVAGLTGLAAIAGGTFAMVQPTPAPIAVRSSAEPSAMPSAIPSAASVRVTKPPIAATSTRAQSKTQSGTRFSSEANSEETAQGSQAQGSQPNNETSPVKASRTVESCETTMARIEDPDSPINIRSQPNSTTPDTIVGTAKTGTYVTVVDEKSDWFKISTPQKGWIAKRLTVHGCNAKVERVNFGRNETTTLLQDEFIGTGSHSYRLRLMKGQKLRVFAQKGPLPMILAPDGRELNALSDEGTVWSRTLTSTGDYKVIYDSNFKGYKYAAEIEARS